MLKIELERSSLLPNLELKPFVLDEEWAPLWIKLREMFPGKDDGQIFKYCMQVSEEVLRRQLLGQEIKVFEKDPQNPNISREVARILGGKVIRKDE